MQTQLIEPPVNGTDCVDYLVVNIDHYGPMTMFD